MTIRQILDQIFVLSGELTPLEFRDETGEVDVSSEGFRIMLDWLNQAQVAVAMWKRPQSRQYANWKLNLSQKFMKLESYQLTGLPVVDPENFDVISADNLVPGAVGKFVISPDSGEVRQIVEQAPGELFVDRPFDDPIGTWDLWVGSNYFEIPGGEFWAGIQEIVSLPDRTPLDQIKGRGYFEVDQIGLNVPTRWYRAGRRIYMDAVSADNLRVLVLANLGPAKLPVSFDIVDLEPEIYEPYHYALVVWCLIQAFGLAQEPTMKYSYTKQFEEIMMTTQTELDFQDNDLSFQHSAGGN